MICENVNKPKNAKMNSKTKIIFWINIFKLLKQSKMLGLDILTSDSEMELDAIEEQKPRKKYEVSNLK